MSETKPKPNGPKGEIKFNIQLNEEQKIAKSIILENEITIVTGKAGTGKTALLAQVALDLLFKKRVEKVFITRPTQMMGENLGFLPGSLEEKIDPYLDPFKENFYKCYDKLKIDDILSKKQIEGFPIQFARGKTIGSDCILICDEMQNATKHQMLGLLTRLGKGGKIIILGDNDQKDTKESYTGLSYVIDAHKHINEIQWVKLKENHRSDLVGKILDYEYSGK